MNNKDNFTQKDCFFLLLAKTPTGKIHQVIVKQEEIQRLISELKDFKVVEKPITGIDF